MNNEKRQHMKQAFTSVFKGTDPLREMFTDFIKERLLLCHTNGFYLNKRQFQVFLKVIKILGDTSFYVSQVEGCNIAGVLDTEGCDDDHWELSTEISYEEYRKNLIIFENAIYSTSGKWGVLISQADHAVVGGSHEFIELFKKFYKEWDEDIKEFIKKWEYNKEHYNSDVSWLQDFLNYVDAPTEKRINGKTSCLACNHFRS